jgi:hypothetical protein
VETIDEQPEAAPVVAPEPDEAQRRAERERALAEIPADAYDIPLEVLVLSDHVRTHLKKAQIKNLGQIMECLVDGDQSLLALEGIDSQALNEIKTQVEIMVSIAPREPEVEAPVETEPPGEPEAPSLPRYEYVLDDELERKAKPKRGRKKKQRRLVYGADIGEWDEVDA